MTKKALTPDHEPARLAATGRDTDAAFQSFTHNFCTRVSDQHVVYHVDDAVAAACLALQQSFAAKLVRANDPLTKGPSATFAKNEARKLLLAETQRLANQIEGAMAVSDQLKRDLGLTIRKGTRTPVGRPASAPFITVVRQSGLLLRVRLGDEADPARRGRPQGVAFASVMTFVGDRPPADPAAWVFQGNTSRNVMGIAFPPETPPGSTVWVCAVWSNLKTQTGPVSSPLPVRIAGTVGTGADNAAGKTDGMKIAA